MKNLKDYQWGKGELVTQGFLRKEFAKDCDGRYIPFVDRFYKPYEQCVKEAVLKNINNKLRGD